MRVVNEEVMIDYPRCLVKDMSCAPYVIKMIVSQVESMIELCISTACLIVIMLMIVLNLCNDCNDLVGCSHKII